MFGSACFIKVCNHLYQFSAVAPSKYWGNHAFRLQRKYSPVSNAIEIHCDVPYCFSSNSVYWVTVLQLHRLSVCVKPHGSYRPMEPKKSPIVLLKKQDYPHIPAFQLAGVGSIYVPQVFWQLLLLVYILVACCPQWSNTVIILSSKVYIQCSLYFFQFI